MSRAKLLEMISVMEIPFNKKSNSVVLYRKLITAMNANYEKAADLWVEGNNSGSEATYNKLVAQGDGLQEQCDKALAVVGVTVEYPGLYPYFKYGTRGCEYHSLSSLLVDIFNRKSDENVC